MIAKAACITHGANATRYSVDKDKAELVKVNLLPADIEPEAIWQRMQVHQKKFEAKINRYRTLKNGMIRMEISPTREETEGWTMYDWVRLADEYIHEFDHADMRNPKRKTIPKPTNLANSQYVVSLHHDSKGHIDHLHINANRVDIEGNVNTDKFIAERAITAAQVINRRRGWGDPEEISRYNKTEITKDCYAILRNMAKFEWNEYEKQLESCGYKTNFTRDKNGIIHGYSIMKGNSKYKSSELGESRDLMPSKILATWAKKHSFGYKETEDIDNHTVTSAPKQHSSRLVYQPVVSAPPMQAQPKSEPVLRSYDIATDEYHNYPVEIASDIDDYMMSLCSVPENSYASIEHVQNTALLLFAEYIKGATSMSVSAGGGGSDLSGWGRKEDEDDREYARRCAIQANRMCVKRRGMRR